MSNSVILSDTREVPLLHFLWKWKVTTTAALIKKFFPNCKGKTAYNRLLSLRHAGLIQVRSDGKGQKFVCTLDQKGFDAIREDLPELKEEGFKSEFMAHDLLVSAFHLGDWLVQTPEGAALFSEQQLRRYHPDFYPDWVPKSQVHRPDGYSKIMVAGKPKLFSIEVELNYKRNTDYLKIAEFYSQIRSISKVLWLVPRASTAESLDEKLSQKSTRSESPHNFVLLDEFQKLGWSAPIVLGPDQGKTVLQVFSEGVPDPVRNLTAPSLGSTLLDLRKSPHVSTIYRGYQAGDFAD